MKFSMRRRDHKLQNERVSTMRAYVREGATGGINQVEARISPRQIDANEWPTFPTIDESLTARPPRRLDSSGRIPVGLFA
jgi:hypothetical protein